MLKEQAIAIIQKRQDSSLNCFRVKYGWLDGWRSVYVMKEHQNVSEAGDDSEE